MEMQVAGAGQAGRRLTIEWLYGEVQSYVNHTIHPRQPKLERAAFVIGFAAAGLGLLAAVIPGNVLGGGASALLISFCLLVELGGFAVGGFFWVRRTLTQLLQPRLTHAREMDGDFVYWQGMVRTLRSFPEGDREELLRFVNDRRVLMTERLGFMFGGLQKLGPFPVLVAIYLQFRNWQWGDWSSAFDVTGVAAFLIYVMVLLYLSGLMQMGMRNRLDTYVNLLTASLKEPAAAE